MVASLPTPLFRKLGIKPEMIVYTVDAPRNLNELLGELPEGARLQSVDVLELGVKSFTLALLFSIDLEHLYFCFRSLLGQIGAHSVLWIARPKKSSGVETNLNFQNVQELGLRYGLVDNKICAIDATWTGIRFSVRMENRKDWDPEKFQ